MPSVHSLPSATRPSPVPQNDFAFPVGQHLLITTPSRILSWDSLGLHTLFKSSRHGIAAATESKDGSGILAIADKHVVVLHDTKHGKEKSWGLSAAQDEVRHLQYTKDSKSLFLSTKVTNAIQCYSTQEQQLLSPPQTLASPPAALAVSPTGHLMISAQGSPPVVFLKDLASNSTATLLKPQATTAGVAVAAFHPERANIFLLAFGDGTVGVFDASRLSRTSGEGRYVDQHHMGKGEIGRKKQLHRAARTSADGGLGAITGAAFIPGHKVRVITVGMDGRCHLVDFSDGVNVLRTWHAKAPLTSVSVLAPGVSKRDSLSSQKSRTSIRSDGTKGCIAVGTYDGSVILYDLLGIQQSHQRVDRTGERIISVEWVEGPSPKSITSAIPTNGDVVEVLPTAQNPEKSSTSQQRKVETPKHLKAHPALRPSQLSSTLPSPQQPRQFTIHPDETAQDSTVRHTPAAKGAHAISAEAGAYMDLFSPVNPFAAEQSRQNREQSFSPTRVRPRISSQTFVTDFSPTKNDVVSTPSTRKPKLLPTASSHGTSSETMTIYTAGKRGVQFKPSSAASKSSPLKTERRKVVPRSVRKREHARNEGTEVLDGTAAANAKLLRDLRRMNVESANPHAGSVLQSYASSGRKQGKLPLRDLREVAPVPISQSSGHETQQPVKTKMFGRDGQWPTDSVEEPSWSEEQEDDIWITSDEERKRSSSRRHYLSQKQVAGQESRPDVEPNETITTKSSAGPGTEPGRTLDTNVPRPIMSADEYTTAQSHVSPDGAFSLASDDVKSMFPRTSSVSPQRTRKDADRRSRQNPRHRKTALQEIASNSVAVRRPSDPWARMKQAKNSQIEADTVHHQDPASDLQDKHAVQPHAHGEACSGCAANASKVRALEGEVAHMKGEILALRAMLRRNNIPAPAIPGR